jgi:hypothetical protein
MKDMKGWGGQGLNVQSLKVQVPRVRIIHRGEHGDRGGIICGPLRFLRMLFTIHQSQITLHPPAPLRLRGS